jgi:hypothetical protein
MADNGTVEDLSRGYSGTAKTIETMWKLVQKGKLDPTLQKIASWIVLHSGVDARTSNRQMADAIFHWVKENGLFIRDPFQIEKLETPEEAMKSIAEAKEAGTYSGSKIFVGDCDTYSVITNSLAGILGFQTAFETTKNDPDRPDEFSHVYPALLIAGEGWVAYDASTPGSSPGWRPPSEGLERWHESPIENVIGGRKWLNDTVEEVKNMSGMNGLGYGYAGGSYWGTGEPQYLETPDNQPLLNPPDPGSLVWMAPTQPADHAASTGDFVQPDNDWLYNPQSELMRDDRSLAERSVNIMTLPEDLPYSYPFYQKPVGGVSVQTPFPPEWPWSYQVEQLPGQQQLIAETDNPSMTATAADALDTEGMAGTITFDESDALARNGIPEAVSARAYPQRIGPMARQNIEAQMMFGQASGMVATARQRAARAEMMENTISEGIMVESLAATEGAAELELARRFGRSRGSGMYGRRRGYDPAASSPRAQSTQTYAQELTADMTEGMPATSGMGQGYEWYDPEEGISLHTPEGMSPEDASWMYPGAVSYNPEYERLKEAAGEPTWMSQDLDKWYPEPSGGYSGGPIGGKTQKEQDDEDHSNLLDDIGNMFGGLIEKIPELGSEWGSSYLKQREMKLARDIANARTEAEKERARSEYYKSRTGSTGGGGGGSDDNGLPGWLLPVGIGAGVLLVGATVLMKK